jgi:hypothetical protein
MNRIVKNGLSSSLRKSKAVAPKSYLEEMAELGIIDSYISTYFQQRYESDPEFRSRVFDAKYRYQKVPDDEVIIHFLEQLGEALAYFREYIKDE